MYNIKPGHIFGNLELDILVLNTFSKWNIHFREKRECNAILLFRRALVQNISNFVPTILAMYHIYCIKFPFLLIVVATVIYRMINFVYYVKIVYYLPASHFLFILFPMLFIFIPISRYGLLHASMLWSIATI